MSELIQVIADHPWAVAKLLLGYWLFSAIVSGMPAPDPAAKNFTSAVIYQWAFSTLHTFSGSMKTAVNDPRLQAALPNALKSPENKEPKV